MRSWRQICVQKHAFSWRSLLCEEYQKGEFEQCCPKQSEAKLWRQEKLQTKPSCQPNSPFSLQRNDSSISDAAASDCKPSSHAGSSPGRSISKPSPPGVGHFSSSRLEPSIGWLFCLLQAARTVAGNEASIYPWQNSFPASFDMNDERRAAVTWTDRGYASTRGAGR